MSKIKDFVHDFLEGGGFELGYDWDKLPGDLFDMNLIIEYHINYEDYKKGLTNG